MTKGIYERTPEARQRMADAARRSHAARRANKDAWLRVYGEPNPEQLTGIDRSNAMVRARRAEARARALANPPIPIAIMETQAAFDAAREAMINEFLAASPAYQQLVRDHEAQCAALIAELTNGKQEADPHGHRE